MLFDKLGQLQINESTINLIKIIYKNTAVTINNLQDAVRTNSGVI